MIDNTAIHTASTRTPTVLSLLLFNFFLLAALILSTRLATILHEFLGHAFMAALFGAKASGVQISLFGGGHTYYELQENMGLGPRFLIAFGGILINLISGAAVLFFKIKRKKGSPWRLFVLLFGTFSLLGSLAYTTLGFYYEVGDPVSWLDMPSPRWRWLWIPFLSASPFASFWAIKSYAGLNEAWFPAKSYFHRLAAIVMTLGVTGCVYGALYVATSQTLTAWDAPTLAHERERQSIREAKTKARYHKLREQYPELTDQEIRALAEETPIIIKPEELPKKFPLKPVIAFLCLVGGVLAPLNVKGHFPSSAKRLSFRTMLLTVFLAGSLLAYLAWTGGWIYGY